MAGTRSGKTKKMDIRSPMAGLSGTIKKRSGTTKKRSGKTKKMDIRKKEKVTRWLVKPAEMDAFYTFMFSEFMCRYFQTHVLPDPKVPATFNAQDEMSEAGQEEWGNMADKEKNEWKEKLNKMNAEGKDLQLLEAECRDSLKKLLKKQKLTLH